MSKWFVVVPFVGMIGLGALAAGYDGVMAPIRAERDFNRKCHRDFTSQGVTQSAAEETCDCMMAQTRALAETSTADEISRADATRITQSCINRHIGASDRRDAFGRPLPEDNSGWGKPGDGAGWGNN